MLRRLNQGKTTADWGSVNTVIKGMRKKLTQSSRTEKGDKGKNRKEGKMKSAKKKRIKGKQVKLGMRVSNDRMLFKERQRKR